MSSIRPIEVPKWGMTMDEGTIDEWYLAEGDSFSEGDLLCSIESTKVMNDLAANFDGVLRRIVAHSGDVLPVGSLIGVAADPSVDDSEIDAYIAERTGGSGDADGSADTDGEDATSTPAAESAPAAPATPPAAQAAAQSVPASLRGDTGDDIFATPHALGFAREHGIDLGKVTGTGRGGRISLADVETAVTSAGGAVPEKTAAPRSTKPLRSTADDSAVEATPVARRLAAELGVNLHDCRATGRNGRVCVPDVEEAARRFGLDRPDTQVGSAASPGTTGGAAAVLTGDVANTPEAVPFTGMRRAIATRLQQSAQTSPHFRVNQEVQIDELLALRRQINATVPAVKVSVNDLIVKAVATTLLRVPEVNVQFDEATQTVLRFPSADVSVAVSVPDGLITPIVRAADRKTLSQISEDIRDLAIRAKAGNLLPDEFQGGTFTVSNLGMFGVSSFDAVINPPQAAILAVGAGVRRPVVLDDGSVEPRTVLTLSLAADHRVIDGALAATFIGELKGILEQPAQMLV
ncbi:2-oxo acid dehydrogenase subunit E2 [Corynebacterium neomassiliense]|uniref:2-oxo acid dehydrogenase subunit E2 n=1 Tax=Corynebacterium neomassiliense TaxID=2079482 RepID=UPI0010321663|nr:2-oxo acid dehydrogenase subunit E2 [Corynebacterium neomassiliense]